MAKELLLRLIDGDYKENEVTGNDMGGQNVYLILTSLLKPGKLVDWPLNSERPNHGIVPDEIGEDYVKLTVWNVGSSSNSITLHLGESYSDTYCFGEWSYSYRISLEEASEETIAAFGPGRILAEAEACDDYIKRIELYESAAKLNSPEAYAWLVNHELTKTGGYGPELYKAQDWLKEAVDKGVGEKAKEVFDARPAFYVVDGVLLGVYRGGKLLTVPEDVVTIATYSFSRCRFMIEKLIVPSSVKEIQDQAFTDCKFIREVEIQGPANIGKYVFHGCSALKKITLDRNAQIDGEFLAWNMKNVEVIYK